MQEKGRILIIDDDFNSQKTLESFLQSENYDIFFASSGKDALNDIDSYSPDVILLDILMPIMNGFEVCRILKASETWKNIPVILITALSGTKDMLTGIDAGADDFISKPVSVLELQARVRSMYRIKKQYDKLKESLELRETLSHMIIHDMRSPIAAIMGTSDVLKLIAEDEKHLESAKLIFNEANKLNRFLDDILLMAKMESGRTIAVKKNTYIEELIQNIKDQYSILAKNKSIRIEVKSPKEQQHISIDKNLIYRVLDNLISNAVKYSDFDTKIIIRWEYPEDSQLKLQIEDTGPGIKEKHKSQIFNKFEIVELKQQGIPQVGLGLAFCKLAIEAHNGKIYVEDNNPKGSIFTIEL